MILLYIKCMKNSEISGKTLALEEVKSMIRYENPNQAELEFEMPFGKLNPDNRWIQLSKIVPWDEIKKVYDQSMSSSTGAGSVPARVAVGALILKHLTNQTDEEIIESIRENPYFQYFLGYSSFSDRQVFTPSLFVSIRRRLGSESVESLIEKLKERDATPSEATEEPEGEPPANAGTLMVDATVSPADIKYPTDGDLLNASREKSEQILDLLWARIEDTAVKKPRTYRDRAHREYLEFSHKRKKSHKKVKAFIRKQLGYLKRNIRYIHELLDKLGDGSVSYRKMGSWAIRLDAVADLNFALKPSDQRTLWIITELLRQQQEMYDSGSHSTPGRIVSISQPYVRPIVRGKAGKTVEFGAKLNVSMVDGLLYCDRLSWDNFNEALDLPGQIESYKHRFGYYPEKVHADKIYWNAANRKYCKDKNIKLFGAVPLGRPGKTPEAIAQRKADAVESAQRNAIEGAFGVGKRRFGLDRIMAKTRQTSENWIAMLFFVFNLARIARDLFLSLFFWPVIPFYSLKNLWNTVLGGSHRKYRMIQRMIPDPSYSAGLVA